MMEGRKISMEDNRHNLRSLHEAQITLEQKLVGLVELLQQFIEEVWRELWAFSNPEQRLQPNFFAQQVATHRLGEIKHPIRDFRQNIRHYNILLIGKGIIKTHLMVNGYNNQIQFFITNYLKSITGGGIHNTEQPKNTR